MAALRFPPPWSVEDIGAPFVVTDGAEQKLAYGKRRPPTQQLLAPFPSRLCRANQTEPAGWAILPGRGKWKG
jgi:hypothetical protein